MTGVAVSIVVPALDEERYIGPTLDSLRSNVESLAAARPLEVEIIVVDNGSSDRTAEVARSGGATVIDGPRGSIAAARNSGAAAASGRILVFVDADTLWPASLLGRIVSAMSDERCLGGAVDTDYRAARASLRAYLALWRVVGRLFRLAQGATQFCRASAFSTLGGYDESLYMGEDVDFYRRLRKAARSTSSHVAFIDQVRVKPSTRRFDRWPLWKTALWTNPFVVLLCARSKGFWVEWYESPTR